MAILLLSTSPTSSVVPHSFLRRTPIPSPRTPLPPAYPSASKSLGVGLGFSSSEGIGAASLLPIKCRLNSSPLKPLVPWSGAIVRATLAEVPVVWFLRTLAFAAIAHTGFLSSPSNGASTSDEQQTTESRKLRSRWQTTVKGTLKRRCNVPTKAEGRRLLKNIGSLLSEDDSFRDATSHKGCQIRRENAHAETVCCHNVRAMFDELPAPHLVVEITPFPVGPISTVHYEKAEKIERLLRSGNSI